MTITTVVDGPWTRKHDDPRYPFIERTARTVYPTSLAELVRLCRDRPPGERYKAAGSHWSLSLAALSDHTFIETHGPDGTRQAMARTLHDVVPGCLNRAYVAQLVRDADERKRTLVHVEAGKRIYQLYAELDQVEDVGDTGSLAGFINREFSDPTFGGPWALATAGNAGGQTIVGAISTGTHGSDFDRPPLADAVVALHLVVDGGQHYWIEAVDTGLPPLTDDDRLLALFGTDELYGPENFEIIRDNDVFEAVLVSVGRFGIIYSVVLTAVPQYALHERRRLHTWQEIKGHLRNGTGPLYVDSPPASAIGRQRSLQIAVSLTPHGNFQLNRVGVTRRWTSELHAGTPGRAERVGAKSAQIDPLIQAHRFEHAGRSHPYNPHPAHPERAGDPSLLEKACADRSFLRGVVDQVIQEIEDFVDSDGAVVGSAITAVAAFGGGALILLIPALLVILAILKLIREALDDDDTRFGETMEGVKNQLLDPAAGAAVHGAGLFAWQMIYLLAFESQQKERDYDAISYAVTDQRDYPNQSCEVNVESIEVFFDAFDSRLVAFVDALIEFEKRQEIQGRAFVGYASLRFMGPTRALLGMQRHPRTCSVEIACLKDVTGGTELIEYAIALARHPDTGGILHWGQRNEFDRADVERIYGTGPPAPGGTLQIWRAALTRLSGGRDGFSSAFTVGTGLEEV